jgi:hypothetical protein
MEEAKDNHKFSLGEEVTNTRTGETGKITGFDITPKVYIIKTNNGGFRLWGELEMVPAK